MEAPQPQREFPSPFRISDEGIWTDQEKQSEKNHRLYLWSKLNSWHGIPLFAQVPGEGEDQKSVRFAAVQMVDHMRFLHALKVRNAKCEPPCPSVDIEVMDNE